MTKERALKYLIYYVHFVQFQIHSLAGLLDVATQIGSGAFDWRPEEEQNIVQTFKSPFATAMYYIASVLLLKSFCNIIKI